MKVMQIVEKLENILRLPEDPDNERFLATINKAIKLCFVGMGTLCLVCFII